MKSNIRWGWVLLALGFAGSSVVADELSGISTGVRIMSWNVSDDAFVSDPTTFRALLLRADADILLLDEVAPSADADQLRNVLVELSTGNEDAWHIDFGKSGGRQRGVIASRMQLEALPELSSIVPYPESDRRRIQQRMSSADRSNPAYSMDEGIPVNATVILISDRRLLVVVADLQCCGDEPESWQEFRRRIEVREIRRLIRQVLDRTRVDSIILAGDFNLVSTVIPLAILTGPYRPPHSGLIPVELYHRGGSATWTWDGRGKPFPSRALDFQLYSPQSLHVREGFILDTEDLSSEELEHYGLQPETSSRLSGHRPLVVEYAWH